MRITLKASASKEQNMRSKLSAETADATTSMWTQETVADELEEAYRSHIWDPSLRHVQKQKQGFTAARVELTSLVTKVNPAVHSTALQGL